VLPLTEVAGVYRSLPVPAKGANVRDKIQAYPTIPCLIVPVSSFDRVQAYGLESTHVVWVPQWLELLKEDEVRTGRRTDPVSQAVSPYVYVVNGRRKFRVGLIHRAYYATERD
jgi:hypothetical protein